MNETLNLFDVADEPPRRLPIAPHNRAETSRVAAYHAAATGQVQEQEKAILRALAHADWLRNGYGMTRKDITHFLNDAIPESRVGARVNRLIQNGMVREDGTRVPVGGSVRQKVCFITAEGLAAIREGGK